MNGYTSNQGGFRGQNQPASGHRQHGHRPAGQLRNVLSYSFSGNHLVEISLAYEPQTSPQKKHFFCFVKLLPGGKNGNERTYISDQHITLKLSLDKVLELAKALRAFSAGHGVHFGPYTTFTDTSKAGATSENTNAGKKSLRVSYAPDDGKKEPKIMLSFALDKSHHSFPMTPYSAGSMADIVEQIAKEGLTLEFERMKECARPNRQMQ